MAKKVANGEEEGELMTQEREQVEEGEQVGEREQVEEGEQVGEGAQGVCAQGARTLLIVLQRSPESGPILSFDVFNVLPGVATWCRPSQSSPTA